MNPGIGHERSEAIAALIAETKAVMAQGQLSRSSLRKILGALEDLAAKRHLWSSSSYPDPIASNESLLYNVAEDQDRNFALYLDVACPGKKVPPHNHTTWACIAAIDGCEDNILFDREDDGARAGFALLREIKKISVRPGFGISLMPDDIHAIANSEATYGRHLHFYGRALETLASRLQFNLTKQTVTVMPLAVTIRI